MGAVAVQVQTGGERETGTPPCTALSSILPAQPSALYCLLRRNAAEKGIGCSCTRAATKSTVLSTAVRRWLRRVGLQVAQAESKALRKQVNWLHGKMQQFEIREQHHLGATRVSMLIFRFASNTMSWALRTWSE